MGGPSLTGGWFIGRRMGVVSLCGRYGVSERAISDRVASAAEYDREGPYFQARPGFAPRYRGRYQDGMSATPDFLSRPDGERLAFQRVDGDGPTVIWIGGFRSDMEGTKALALEAAAR